MEIKEIKEDTNVQEYEWKLEVFLLDDTPVVGCEIKPPFHVYITGSLSKPEHFNVQFKWFRHQDHEYKSEPFIHIGSTDNYTPSIDDIGSSLGIMAVGVDEDGNSKSNIIIIATHPTIVPRTHIQRSMIDFNNKKTSDGQNFTVLSYNILADILVNTQKYYYCPPWALTWAYRKQNLLTEMKEYDADVVCLQELQSDHYEKFFKPEMEKMGYLSVYKAKTIQVFTVARIYTSEGCAIFFKKSRFTPLKQYEVEFSKYALPIIEELKPNKKNYGYSKLMKDNIAIAVILEDNISKSKICVANTHLHWDPRNPEVKMLQATNLINGLQKIDSLQIPVVICGDMNSLPNSHLVHLITDGYIKTPKDSTSFPHFYDHVKLHHSINLASAYTPLYTSEKRFLFTSITPRFKGTLDYIFYTQNNLSVESVLQLLDNESLEEMPLPSPLWSSDHISLMANFKIPINSQQHQRFDLPLHLWE